MRTPTLLLGLLSLLLVTLLGPSLRAEDELDREAPEALGLRIYDLGALCAGVVTHLRDAEPTTLADYINDEERPLFGAEGEEPMLPLGSLDEIIEILKTAVHPWFWEEREGADMRALSWDRLVVRATPTAHAELARFLGSLEREHGRLVTVDVHAARLTLAEAEALRAPDGGLDADAVAALLEGSDAGPSVSVTATTRARSAIVAGSIRTSLHDADVEVAEESAIADPLVMSGTLGLSVGVQATVGHDGTSVLLDLDASMSTLAEESIVNTGATGRIEVATHGLTRVATSMVLRADVWTLVDGGGTETADGSWFFLVRARPHETPLRRTEAKSYALPSLPGPVVSPMRYRTFPVHVLNAAPAPRVGSPVVPRPSNHMPPEPPELAEPQPACYPEQLVELLQEAGSYQIWQDPASIEARNGFLIVRNTPPVLDAVDGVLNAVRRACLWSVETTVEVVELPEAVARLVGTGGPMGDGARALLDEALASGQASRIGTAQVTSQNGTRNAVTTGRIVTYVSDYHVEIAKGSSIMDPEVQQFLDGLVVDITPARAVDGSGLSSTLRVLRTHPVGPIRKVTVGGSAELQLPEVDVFRVGADVRLLDGRTMIAASRGEGGRRRLLLLTPRLR